MLSGPAKHPNKDPYQFHVRPPFCLQTAGAYTMYITFAKLATYGRLQKKVNVS